MGLRGFPVSLAGLSVQSYTRRKFRRSRCIGCVPEDESAANPLNLHMPPRARSLRIHRRLA